MYDNIAIAINIQACNFNVYIASFAHVFQIFFPFMGLAESNIIIFLAEMLNTHKLLRNHY